MNRTVKDAINKAFQDPDLDAPKAHVLAFVTAYNSAKRLKAVRWRTPFKSIYDAWQRNPSPFKINTHQFIPEPNT